MAATMQAQDWDQVMTLFSAALELPASQRVDYVQRESAHDERLTREVLSLLDAHDGADDFFDQVFAQLEPDEFALGLEGKRLGAYRVLTLLGEGGMGNVYVAERADDEYQQRVAIKILPVAPLQDAQLERFRVEKQALAQLEHPNIARLIDAGVSQDGAPFIVMELIEGLAIDEFCDRNTLTIDERLALFAKVCEAVAFAHQHLVLHCDLKPANILVTGAGEVKLLDFGIARILSPDERQSPEHLVTLYQDRPLTPSYAAPEQWQRLKSTTMTDVYALGAVLFRLLCGAQAIRKRDVQTLRARPHSDVAHARMVARLGGGEDGLGERAGSVARKRGTTLRALRRRLRGDLQNIVSMAMAREPALRYPSAVALRYDIENYLARRTVTARPPAFAYTAVRWASRNRVALAIAAVVVALAATTVVTSVQSALRSAEQARRIEIERDTAQRVATLMGDVFAAGDPEASRGNTITVREALTEGADRVLGALTDQPALQISLTGQIGRVYSNLGLHREAQTHWQQVLDGVQTLESRGPLSAAQQELAVDAHRLLGDALLATGRYDEAGVQLARARQLAIDTLPAGHNAHLHVTNSLTEMYFYLRDSARSLALAEAAVAIAAADPTLDFRARTLAYNNLAAALYQIGRRDEAATRFRELLTIQGSQLPLTHPDIMRVKANLAGVYVTMQRVDDASKLYQQVIDAARSQNVAPNRSTAQALYGLGLVQLNGGDYGAAERLIGESIELNSTFKSEPDYEITLQKFMLGQALEMQDKAKSARRQYEDALTTAKVKFGQRGLTGRLLAQLAGLAADDGRWDDARDLLSEATTVFDADATVRPQHTAYATAIAGRLAWRAGDRAGGQQLMDKAMAILDEELSANAPQRVRVRAWRGAAATL